ncbi:MAG: hypothetical protein HOE90_01060 [Bacteriovoracaceae bacterium]|jgi:putative selenate reductase|nr:hypothetical protein [Bacteriovoracaceae bacterium]
MIDLFGMSLTRHLDAILNECQNQKSIYGIPLSKMYKGHDQYDISTSFHGASVYTPIGPAAGPHTQMIQNIILSFLGGARIMELKTVQVLDGLEIPRPCIDARNICYNVEWSQELKLEASLDEYVRAWMLLKIIEELELLEIPKGSDFYHCYFDLSVGYDLAGISSPQVSSWIHNMMDASKIIEKEIGLLPERFNHLKSIDYCPKISHSITLSTFHGCPRDEIEKIVHYLFDEFGLDVIVKMNPTLLGHQKVGELLHDKMGYSHIGLPLKAFEHDLNFSEGVQMMKRLREYGEKKGKHFGAKFTNTLVVEGDHSNLAGSEQYLSGAPLHVISMNTMHQFRSQVGADFPVSFSAGVDTTNIVDTVLCNMTPVSMCTDLLKKGGYLRLKKYIDKIYQAMEESGVKTLEELILSNAGSSSEDLAEAGLINATRVCKTLEDNDYYHFEKNKKDPRKTDVELELFDCLSCNICIPVCPNGANFYLPIGEVSEKRYTLINDQGKISFDEGAEFILHKKIQIGNIVEFCNSCSNCDTFCPELGGPYIVKPKFFLMEKLFDESEFDGFYLKDGRTLLGRINGEYFTFTRGELDFSLSTKNYDVEFDAEGRPKSAKTISEAGEAPGNLDLVSFNILKAIFRGTQLGHDGGVSLIKAFEERA